MELVEEVHVTGTNNTTTAINKSHIVRYLGD